jgi:undecaprenyldiphospho-muramoylpentapeptide beta-N-acetylglucosaminyltransferase
VLEALDARHAEVDTLWVGGETGMEAELVKREGVSFATIPAAGLQGVGFRALPRIVVQITRGLLASRRILHMFRPDVLFFTGGFLAGPMAVAGRNVPTMLYVPDIEPGLALKSLARFADRIAVTAAESQTYFSQKVVVTGYPVRAGLAKWTKAKAREALQLRDDVPVVLIAGGSKGARSINQAVVANLPTMLELAQIVHLTGQLEREAVAAATSNLTKMQRARYRAFAYLHERMGAALTAADIAVARAGASVLGELPMAGLPAVLVPYPHAWRYQRVNADYLAQHNAAIVVDDSMLSHQLPIIVRDLLRNSSKREAMRSAMRTLAHPRAAQALADQLLELGGKGP